MSSPLPHPQSTGRRQTVPDPKIDPSFVLSEGARDRCAERSLHPRARQSTQRAVVVRPATESPIAAARVLADWLVARLGLPGARPDPARDSDQACLSLRRARLHAIVGNLEATLEELDELGLERSAIDVCMALDRVKSHIDDCDRDRASL